MKSVDNAVQAAIIRYFAALDGRDWAVCLDSFCPTFDADYTAMVGGEPFKGLPREANMPAWTGMMDGFLETAHSVVITSITSNEAERVATLTASVTATHLLPSVDGDSEARKWTAIGSYLMNLKRGEDGAWRIRAITFKQDSSDPADSLPFIEEAKERATAAATAATPY